MVPARYLYIRHQILEGGILVSQPADCLCLSSSLSNGDVPMSLMAVFTRCLKDRFGLDVFSVGLLYE